MYSRVWGVALVRVTKGHGRDSGGELLELKANSAWCMADGPLTEGRVECTIMFHADEDEDTHSRVDMDAPE